MPGNFFSMKLSSLSKLKPVENLTQVDKIEISLQEYFRNSNFQPGDIIPKETELAEALGVSRTAIREAIARFKTLGIIESRKNRGMIITRPDLLSNMQRILDSNLLDGETLKEIFELRLVLEMGIVDILFIRKKDEHLNKLEEIVGREEKSKNRTEIIRCDIEFHSMLYCISGNNTIERFHRILNPVFDYVDNVLHIDSQVNDEHFVTHRHLLDSLRDETPEEFRLKMKSHLINYFEKLKAAGQTAITRNISNT